ncbi:hypothetical protein L7F22_042959 [Adiantum nelumboides]|nr:hypothetical protein [Adiantum nelumboides]
MNVEEVASMAAKAAAYIIHSSWRSSRMVNGRSQHGKEEACTEVNCIQEVASLAASATSYAGMKLHSWRELEQLHGKRQRPVRTVDVTIAYVPRGYLPVYVGKHNDVHRYLIKAKHLNHPLFVHLLEVVAQEYGYSNNGILNIVCEIELFEKVTTRKQAFD